jgi:hypothetical protein
MDPALPVGPTVGRRSSPGLRWGVGLFVVLALGVAVRIGTRSQEGAVVRMFGEPAPVGLRAVQFETDELFGITPEPSYWLRFEAPAEEVAALLKRGGFLVDPGGGTWSPRPGWPLPKNPARLVVYRREAKPANCVVESLWWDSVGGEVLYHRACP